MPQPVIVAPGSEDPAVTPAGRSWTEEQARAIERRDGDLLLDAGAGSGKTSVLVERFVRSVLDDGLEVGAILTITFTEKAAAELRDRIRVRLRERGAAAAARATEGAFISTIHGFCARVLRAHPLAAGLDPAFTVLDRQQSEPLAAVAFDQALDQLASEQPDAVELLAAYGAGPLRAAILGVYAQLRSGGQLEPRLPPCPAADVDSAWRELVRVAGALAVELGAVPEPSSRVSEALARVQRCRDLLVGEDPWPGALDALRLPGGNGAALSTDACVAYRESLARLRAEYAAVAAVPVRDQLDGLLRAFGERYAALKRGAAGLDFEDLELLTRELLQTDTELRERYAARFARIMVDEFQDTNRVQLELIEAIARGNLFTVGDAQQSIYGFRHADVELFEQRGQRLAAGDARQTLQTNFRSRPEILAALNLTFEDELSDRFRPLVPGRAGQADGAGVELVLVDKGADWALEGLASPWRLAEARALADRVAELVQAGTAPGDIVVLMRATTDMRAYERALERRGLPTYVIGGRGYWQHPQVLDMVAYLRALSNPRDEESLYTVLSSPLVGASLDAVVVLAAAGRAAGRDPWWVLREPGESGAGRDALDSLAAGDQRRLAAFVAWFGAERARADRCSIEELIDGALRRTGYDLAMLAMPGGPRRLANVRKLMRLAREHEAERGPDLRGFVEAVGEREAGRTGDPRESEAPVEGDGLDAIRMMTIHRAKGLEFDTVCVADLGRSVRPPTAMLRVSADGRLGIRLARAGVGGREPALAWGALGEQQQRAEDSEERRLFYVAMTRARERLVLSGAAKLEGWVSGGATGGGPVAWIAPALFGELGSLIAEGGGIVQRGGVAVELRIPDPKQVRAADAGPPGPPAAAAVTPVAPPAPGPPPAGPSPPGPPPAGPPPLPVASLSYSSLGEYTRCGYRFYAERVLGLPPAPEPPPAALVREPPAHAGVQSARPAEQRGVLIHALLEEIDFRRPAVPGADAVAVVAARAGIRPAPGPDEAAGLTALVQSFAASELCARLGRARDVRREERFALQLASGELITGTFDVLAREPGERMLIVDYKSDRLRGADPGAVVQDAYLTQQVIYGLAALRAGAAEAEVVHCFLERPGVPVSARFARSDVGDLEQALERLASGVVGHQFAVTAAPHRALCAGCPAEGSLCSWPVAMTRRESPDRLF
jgi:ATP-dependent helicase/nuclease subunit A